MIIIGFLSPQTINLVLFLIGILISGVLFYVSLVSIIEKEFRAFKVSFLLSTVLFIPFLTIYLYDFQFKEIISSIFLVLILLFVLILFLPIRPKLKGGFQVPVQKHDERDVMFSRNELKPDTENFNIYYSNNPEKKNLDDKFREKPGLLSPKTSNVSSFCICIGTCKFRSN